MIQVLNRALCILEYLGKSPAKEFTLKEIAFAVSLDKSTCARIIKTLQDKGFVSQEKQRGGYKIGYKWYHIIERPVDNEELTKIARKDIDALGAMLNETAMLSVVSNDKRVVLYSTTPDRSILVRTDYERDVFSVCAGRVIIAHYTPQHLDRVLTRLGLPTKEEWPEIYIASSPEQELRNAIARIKHNGYDVMDDNNGITGFAAPLFKNGHVVGCVGLFLPNQRLANRDHILKSVIQCAKSINDKLSH